MDGSSCLLRTKLVGEGVGFRGEGGVHSIGGKEGEFGGGGMVSYLFLGYCSPTKNYLYQKFT